MSTYKAAALLLTLLAAAGCARDNSSDGQTAQARTTLRKISSCSEAADYLLQAAKWEASHPVSSFIGAAGGAGSGTTQTGGAFPAAEDSSSPPTHTATNVQTPGVDEPDLVKTDGFHIYTLADNKLIVVKAWPPSEMAELSRLPLTGYPVSLLIEGNRALVFTQEWVSATAPLTDGALVCKAQSLVRAILVDLSDKTAPAVERVITAEGDFLDARSIDGLVHFVIGNRPTWLYPAALGAPEPVALEAILPVFKDGETGGAPIDPTTGGCSDTYVPDVPTSSGMLMVFSLDLKLPDPPLSNVKIIGTGERIYASRQSLVVASSNDSQWLWAAPQGGIDETPVAGTTLHRFALTDPPAYSTSARVEGWLTGGFSLDEYEGHLRVATTTPAWIGGTLKNAVHVLKVGADSLTEVSTLAGLGKPGESVFAVRFLKERGYLVTFLQTDPLYVLDLADPVSPKVAGTLEVEGVSTYLHPVDDTHLLAVGRGATGGGSLSLFDVTDPYSPKLTATASLGEGSYSEAQYDHHAFTWLPSRNLLAVPVTRWTGSPWADTSSGSAFTGLSVYKVDLATGFSLAGEVDHSLFYKESGTDKWYYPEPVRRSLFIGDQIQGDVLYSLSARGIKATDADDLALDLGAVELPAAPVYWISEPVSSGSGEGGGAGGQLGTVAR